MKALGSMLSKASNLKYLRLFVNGNFFCAQQKFYVTSSSSSTEWSNEAKPSSESDEFIKKQDESANRSNEVKHQILTSALNFVPQFGWSHQSLAAGAQSIGLPGSAHGMFERGPIELVDHFYVTCNKKLSESLKANALSRDSRRADVMPFIQGAFEQRLRMIVPYVDNWSQALSLMIMPTNFPATMKNLYMLVDDVCYYAGDRSADFNWYARRVGIAAVYTTTELGLINDKSEDFADTWAFLSRRINQFSEGEKSYKQATAVITGFPGFVQSSALTLQNMLGLRNRVH